MDQQRPQTSLSNTRKTQHSLNSSGQVSQYSSGNQRSNKPQSLCKNSSTSSYYEDCKATQKVSNGIPNKSSNPRFRPQANGPLALMNKYHISLASYIVNHKTSVKFQGTKRFCDKTGEYYLNNVQFTKNPAYNMEDSVLSQLSLNEPTNLINCNSKCKGLKPLANKASNFVAILPENSLTPIPLTVMEKNEISKLDKKELSNAERAAVHIRRLQYASGKFRCKKIGNNNNAYASQALYSIIIIQQWWKSIYAIIKIQKCFKGWLFRSKLLRKFQKEEEKIKIERVIHGETILKRVIVKKMVTFVFPNEFIPRNKPRLIPNNLLLKLRKYFNRWRIDYGRIIMNPQQLEYQRILVRLIEAQYEAITSKAISITERVFIANFFSKLKHSFNQLHQLRESWKKWIKHNNHKGDINFILLSLINYINTNLKEKNSVPYKKHSGIYPLSIESNEYTFANSSQQFLFDQRNVLNPTEKSYVYAQKKLIPWQLEDGTDELDIKANQIEYDATLSPLKKIEDESINHSINIDKFIILGMKKYYYEHWKDICCRQKILKTLKYCLIKRRKMKEQLNYLRDLYRNNNHDEHNNYRQSRRNRSNSPTKISHEDTLAKTKNKISFEIIQNKTQTCSPIIYSSQSFYLQKDQQIDINQEAGKLQSDYTSLFNKATNVLNTNNISQNNDNNNMTPLNTISKNHSRIQVIKATIPIEENSKERVITKCLSDIDLLKSNAKDKYRQYIFPLNDENIRHQLNVDTSDQVKKISLIQSNLDNNTNSNNSINNTMCNLNNSMTQIMNNTHRKSSNYSGTIDYSPNRSTINRNISINSEIIQQDNESKQFYQYPLKEMNTSQYYHTPIKQKQFSLQSQKQLNTLENNNYININTVNNSQIGFYANLSKCKRRGKKPAFHKKDKDNTINNNNTSQNNTNLSVSFQSNSQAIQIYPCDKNNNNFSKNFRYLWKNNKQNSNDDSLLNESKEYIKSTLNLSRYETDMNNNSIRLTPYTYNNYNDNNNNQHEITLSNGNSFFAANRDYNVKSQTNIFKKPIGRVMNMFDNTNNGIERRHYRIGSCPKPINSKTIHFKFNDDDNMKGMIANRGSTNSLQVFPKLNKSNESIKAFFIMNYRKLWLNNLALAAVSYRKRDNLLYLIKATFFYKQVNNMYKVKEVIYNWLIETLQTKTASIGMIMTTNSDTMPMTMTYPDNNTNRTETNRTNNGSCKKKKEM